MTTPASTPAKRPNSRDVQWTIPDGPTYTLRFGLKAMSALKDRWGCANEGEVAQRMAALEQELDLTRMTDMIWACLRTHHPDVTPAQIMDILDDGGFDLLAEAGTMVGTASSAAMPPQGPRAPAGDTAQTPGT